MGAEPFYLLPASLKTGPRMTGPETNFEAITTDVQTHISGVDAVQGGEKMPLYNPV